MSTKFYYATNSNPVIGETGYHDTDFPHRFWAVVRNMDAVAENWTVQILDYAGKKLGELPTTEIAKELLRGSRKPEVALDIATITTLAAMWSDDPLDKGEHDGSDGVGEFDMHVWLMLAAEYAASGREKEINTKEFNVEWYKRVAAS